MNLSGTFKMPRTRANRSHTGQAHASRRKAERRRIRRQELEAEAAALGISVGEMQSLQYRVTQTLILAQDLIRQDAAAAYRERHQNYGYSRW